MLKTNNYQLNSFNQANGIPFSANGAAPLSAPIESVQKTIEGGVDSFVKTIDEDNPDHLIVFSYDEEYNYQKVTTEEENEELLKALHDYDEEVASQKNN